MRIWLSRRVGTGLCLLLAACGGSGTQATTTTTTGTDTTAAGSDAGAPGSDAGAGSGSDVASPSDTGAAGSDAASQADAGAATTPCPQAKLLLDVGTGKGAGAGYPAAELKGSCSAAGFTVTSNGVPFYSYVAMTPNALKAVSHTWTIPTAPQKADKTTAVPMLGTAGFTVSGLPFYGPTEAAQPSDQAYGDPIYNGLTDGCSGHTSPQEYHNHALQVKCLTAKALTVAEPWTLPAPAADQPSPVIGWALDGFPVYGTYGCMDAACKEVKELKSGYVKTGDPKTNAWQAYTYTAKPDDPTVLDACNGRTEPDGSYGYHATSGFPYIIGCFRGTPVGLGQQGGGGSNNGGGGNPGGGGNNGGPPACASDADCTGKCPPGSVGCACASTPMGKNCVQTCQKDADCGATPTGQKTTCQQGQCKP